MSLALAWSGGRDSALATVETGELVERDGLVDCDILPAAAAVA